MRTIHWMLVVAVALVGGGLLGHLLAPQDTASSASTTVANESAANEIDPAAAPSASRPEDSPMKPAPVPKVAQPPVSTPEAEMPLLRALQQVAAYPRPVGDGVISGRIADADGNAVAGVKVTAMGQRQSGNDYLIRVWDYKERDLWKGLQEDVTHLVRLRKYHMDEQFATVSDADGRYKLAGLSKSPTSLLFSHPRYKFEVLNGQSLQVPDAEVDVVAIRAYPVHVRIVVPEGEEAPTGRLEVVSLENSQRAWPTSQRDAAEWTSTLPAGVYSFQASLSFPANGYVRRVETNQPVVTIGPSDEVQTVTLNFAPKAVLSVAVTPQNWVTRRSRLPALLTFLELIPPKFCAQRQSTSCSVCPPSGACLPSSTISRLAFTSWACGGAKVGLPAAEWSTRPRVLTVFWSLSRHWDRIASYASSIRQEGAR